MKKGNVVNRRILDYLYERTGKKFDDEVGGLLMGPFFFDGVDPSTLDRWRAARRRSLAASKLQRFLETLNRGNVRPEDKARLALSIYPATARHEEIKNILVTYFQTGTPAVKSRGGIES